eukprot:366368-Chlamydomonas_euryale.AAC.3
MLKSLQKLQSALKQQQTRYRKDCARTRARCCMHARSAQRARQPRLSHLCVRALQRLKHCGVAAERCQPPHRAANVGRDLAVGHACARALLHYQRQRRPHHELVTCTAGRKQHARPQQPRRQALVPGWCATAAAASTAAAAAEVAIPKQRPGPQRNSARVRVKAEARQPSATRRRARGVQQGRRARQVGQRQRPRCRLERRCARGERRDELQEDSHAELAHAAELEAVVEEACVGQERRSGGQLSLVGKGGRGKGERLNAKYEKGKGTGKRDQ